MKRILTIIIFVLFLASVAFFMAYGPQIRYLLSPVVRYAYPSYRELEEEMLCAIPASAVWTDGEGETRVWVVSRSDEFPEPAFAIRSRPVTVLQEEKDDIVILDFGGISAADAVLIEWKTPLKEGMCVKPKK